MILGETWVSHRGKHGKEGTRGRISPKEASSVVFFGINDGEIFGDTDVYTAKAPDATRAALRRSDGLAETRFKESGRQQKV